MPRDTVIEVLEYVARSLQYSNLPSFVFGILPRASAENIHFAQELIRLASDDSVEFRVLDHAILVENFDLDPRASIEITSTIRRNLFAKYRDILEPGYIISHRPELQSIRRVLKICNLADSQPRFKILNFAELTSQHLGC